MGDCWPFEGYVQTAKEEKWRRREKPRSITVECGVTVDDTNLHPSPKKQIEDTVIMKEMNCSLIKLALMYAGSCRNISEQETRMSMCQ